MILPENVRPYCFDEVFQTAPLRYDVSVCHAITISNVSEIAGSPSSHSPRTQTYFRLSLVPTAGNTSAFAGYAEREVDGKRQQLGRLCFGSNFSFQNLTVCNFCLKKNVLFSVKREKPILFFVNCERGVLFSVKCNQDPPLPPSCNSNFFTVMTDIKLHYNYNYNSPFILGR